MVVLFATVCLLLCFHGNDCRKPGDISVVIEDGASLRKLGVLYDNPLLRMLGKVFQHTEDLVGKAKDEIFEDLCDLHPCSPWTEWSKCSTLEQDSYGIQTRSRKCGVDSPFCIQPRNIDEDPTVENDIKICEGACKSDYNLTSKGYCFKLYRESLSKSEADEKCTADGAFVVNINDETKSDSLHKLLTEKGVDSQTIWIDGRRQDIDSPWVFLYEDAPVWTNWKSSEPTDGGDQYCRVEEDFPRKWFDRNCNGPYWFVCEIHK